jgi:AcrR family transcriptional regulator
MPTGGKSRSPRRDAAENRTALLESASRVLNADPSAGLEAIAADAGLSRRAVYGHFPTRDALLAEVIRRGAERVAAAAAGVPVAEPLVELALLGRVLWSAIADIRPMAQFAVRGPLRDNANSALRAVHARTRSAVERGIVAGDVRTDLDPEVTARLVGAAAFAVLDEVNRGTAPAAAGPELVVVAGFGALGLSWRETRDFLSAHPTLLSDPSPAAVSTKDIP